MSAYVAEAPNPPSNDLVSFDSCSVILGPNLWLVYPNLAMVLSADCYAVYSWEIGTPITYIFMVHIKKTSNTFELEQQIGQHINIASSEHQSLELWHISIPPEQLSELHDGWKPQDVQGAVLFLPGPLLPLSDTLPPIAPNCLHFILHRPGCMFSCF